MHKATKYEVRRGEANGGKQDIIQVKCSPEQWYQLEVFIDDHQHQSQRANYSQCIEGMNVKDPCYHMIPISKKCERRKWYQE